MPATGSKTLQWRNPYWGPCFAAVFGMAVTTCAAAIAAGHGDSLPPLVAQLTVDYVVPLCKTLFGANTWSTVIQFIAVAAWLAHVVETGFCVRGLVRASRAGADVPMPLALAFSASVFLCGGTHLPIILREARRAASAAAKK